MTLLRDLACIRDRHRGGSATIGNFDGIHIGHQKIISQTVEAARTVAGPATLISFEPLPREFFQGDSAPARLTPLREKYRLATELGLDQLLCLRFGRRLAQMDAEEFTRKVMVDALAIRHLRVGDDFRFGADRAGDFELLREMGVKFGIEVLNTPTLRDNGRRISSTIVREALSEGRFDRVRKLLGRDYSMSGRVVHGDKRGRTLGFPTANVRVARRVSPVHGVFAVEVAGIKNHPMPAVANIGTRPTLGEREFFIETHVFDFDGDLYGRRIEVVLRKKIREERKFESIEALVQQIEQDSLTARKIFGLSE